MLRGGLEKAKARKKIREPEMRKNSRLSEELEREPFGDTREDTGFEDYIWPECGDSDEDEL